MGLTSHSIQTWIWPPGASWTGGHGLNFRPIYSRLSQTLLFQSFSSSEVDSPLSFDALRLLSLVYIRPRLTIGKFDSAAANTVNMSGPIDLSKYGLDDLYTAKRSIMEARYAIAAMFCLQIYEWTAGSVLQPWYLPVVRLTLVYAAWRRSSRW